MTKKEFIELAEKHLTALEGYEIDKNGDLELKIFGFDKLYEAINFTDSSLKLKGKDKKMFEKWKKYLHKNTNNTYLIGDKEVMEYELITVYKEMMDI